MAAGGAGETISGIVPSPASGLGRRSSQSRPATTTDAGVPVASQEHSLPVGPDGPVLLQDSYLIEQMANFNRERPACRHSRRVQRPRDLNI